MTSASRLCSIVEDVFRIRREIVNYYARALIDGGVLPKSRGSAIAQATPRDAVALIVAVAIKPKIKDTAREVRARLDLRGPDGDTAGDLIAALCVSAPGVLSNLPRPATIEVLQDWPGVQLRCNGVAHWRLGSWPCNAREWGLVRYSALTVEALSEVGKLAFSEHFHGSNS